VPGISLAGTNSPCLGMTWGGQGAGCLIGFLWQAPQENSVLSPKPIHFW
jgi:hypothetical protein